MVQNHLRLYPPLALRGRTLFNQMQGIEARIGIALHMAGRPRKINQQAIEHRPAVRARRRIVSFMRGQSAFDEWRRFMCMNT